MTAFSAEREVAASLTDAALGERLEKMAQRPRFFSQQERRAFLLEAADRLQERDGNVYVVRETWGYSERDGEPNRSAHLSREAAEAALAAEAAGSSPGNYTVDELPVRHAGA